MEEGDDDSGEGLAWILAHRLHWQRPAGPPLQTLIPPSLPSHLVLLLLPRWPSHLPLLSAFLLKLAFPTPSHRLLLLTLDPPPLPLLPAPARQRRTRACGSEQGRSAPPGEPSPASWRPGTRAIRVPATSSTGIMKIQLLLICARVNTHSQEAYSAVVVDSESACAWIVAKPCHAIPCHTVAEQCSPQAGGDTATTVASRRSERMEKRTNERAGCTLTTCA